MKQRMINQEHIEGRIYEHNLVLKTVMNQESSNYGKEFISGNIDIATDEAGMNVLTVHFTYVTEYTKSGTKNQTYTVLKKIISEGKTWIADGKDTATKVKIDTSLGLNDFYNQNDELVSAKANEGGFVTIINDLGDESVRNTFTMDMFITNVVEVEVNSEKNIDAPYISLRGAVFNFKNDILPVDFVVKNPAGMKYFENVEINNSKPMFTKLWGKIVSTTSSVIKTEESAFGEENAIHSYERKTKEWVVTGAAKNPYDFGDETILTVEDVNKALQDRNIKLAEIKKRNDEYKANKVQVNMKSFTDGKAMNIPNVQIGSFNF